METPIWINGQVMPLSAACIGVEDRGFQFADGVYEVVRFYDGKLFTLAEHMDRLVHSAQGVRVALPMAIEQIAQQVRRFIPRTGLSDGFIYLQLTRGVAERNHRIPAQSSATLLFYARLLPPAAEPGTTRGVKLLSVADERWKRCWIKSIGLIANVLAKNDALEQGFDEAVFVDRGIVTECSTSNLFAVIGDKIVTHPVGAKVLPGITRLVALQVAETLGVRVEERSLREDEVLTADELFITSTTRELHWVEQYNERIVGRSCGPITLALHRAFRDRVEAETAREIAA